MLKNLDTKRLALWLTLICVASFVLAAGFFFSGNQGQSNGIGGLGIGGTTHRIDEEKSLDLERLDDLKLSTSSIDITVITTNESTIKAHLYGTITTSNADYLPSLTAEKAGNQGTIRVDWPSTIVNIGFSNTDLKLDIYLPQSYGNNLDVETSSGRIGFEQLSLSSFNCSTTSGDVNGSKVTAKQANVKTSSGRIEMSVESSGDLHFKSTSGDMTLNTLKGRTVSCGTSSGRVAISQIEGDTFNFNSTSGDLKVNSISVNSSQLESSSGKLQLNGPSSKQTGIHTTSGDITWTDLESQSTVVETSSGKTLLAGNPGDLKQNSTSGDIDIELSSVSAPVKISTSSGWTKLKLPGDSQFGLTFSSSSGNVDLGGFPFTVEGTFKDNKFNGYVGQETPMINIQSTSGDADLIKR